MRFRAVSPGSASAPNSDLVTRTIHVADRELLERWMERQVLASDRVDVRTWTSRTLLEATSSFPAELSAKGR
jgi:hypothetical protein